MDPLHTRLQATAIRLLAKYGKPAMLLVPGAPTGPEWAPEPGPETAVPCVWLETANSIKNRSGTVIEAGDRFGLVSVASAAVPTLPMGFEADAGALAGGAPSGSVERYSFVAIEPLNPGGLTMFYEVHLRR